MNEIEPHKCIYKLDYTYTNARFVCSYCGRVSPILPKIPTHEWRVQA